MEMLNLLDPDDFTRFFLRADLVERVYPVRGNCSEILTTTGRRYVCGESPTQVAEMLKNAQQASNCSVCGQQLIGGLCGNQSCTKFIPVI